jgi:hypothetical protein
VPRRSILRALAGYMRFPSVAFIQSRQFFLVHGILRYSRWHLELESNPQWQRARGVNAFGAHGLIRGGLTLGGVSLSADAFLFHDGSNGYRQRRFGADISIPVGR